MIEPTPGPWTASGKNVDAGDVHEDGVRVASCWTSSFAPQLPIALANARLIAAAPDLLAACEKAETLILQLLPDHRRPTLAPYPRSGVDYIGIGPEDCEPVRALRAAIAKARGQ